MNCAINRWLLSLADSRKDTQMITSFYLSSEPLRRNEKRLRLKHFVEVKVIDEGLSENIDAMTTDVSDMGLGLWATIPLPIGARVEVNENGQCLAIGRVVSSYECENYDLFRIGVLITEKNDYWTI